MLEYLMKAVGVWLVGFAPLTGLVSAVPAGVVLGLGNASVLVWSVFGAFTPALLIDALYTQMLRFPRLNTYVRRLDSERVRRRVDRWGVWFVLLATPWTTVWAMAVTAKVLGLGRRRFLISAFISIAAWAVIMLVLVKSGMAAFDYVR